MRYFIISLIFLLSSCASYDISNYEYFNNELKKSQEVSNEVIKGNKRISQKAFIYDVYYNEKSIDKIKYPFNSKLENPPYYYQFNNILNKVKSVHKGLIDYSNILTSIATNDFGEVEELSKDVKDSVQNLELTDNQNVNIASFITYKGFTFFTQHKRNTLLEEMITNNQIFIEKISEEMLKILTTLEQSLYLSYDKYYYDLKIYNNEIETIEKIIILTERYEDLKKQIKSVKEFYSQLPQLHKKLLEDDFDTKDFIIKQVEDYSSY